MLGISKVMFFFRYRKKKIKFDPVEGFFVVLSYNFEPLVNSEVVFLFSKMTNDIFFY